MAKIQIDNQFLIDLESELGSSLFSKPLIKDNEHEVLNEIREKAENLFNEYRNNSDDRALAIIGALIIENELDCFLSSWIKNYKFIEDKTDLTFSFKVNLAISLNLIPTQIFNSIEPIRKIRNIFAHHLEIDSFETAKGLKKSDFSMLHNKIDSLGYKKKLDDKGAFIHLILLIIIGLGVYTKDVIKVREYIWNPDNLKIIMES